MGFSSKKNITLFRIYVVIRTVPTTIKIIQIIFQRFTCDLFKCIYKKVVRIFLFPIWENFVLNPIKKKTVLLACVFFTMYCDRGWKSKDESVLPNKSMGLMHLLCLDWNTFCWLYFYTFFYGWVQLKLTVVWKNLLPETKIIYY